MIGRIAGKLIMRQPPQLMVDCHGVGYEIEAPMPVFYQLPQVGEEVVLFIHMVVREDAQLLYGFSSLDQRAMFRELIKVSGVGAKMAVAILSGLSADEFAQCIANQDVNSLTRLPGIGKKTAERLIVEMQDRIGKLSSDTVTLPAGGAAPSTGGDREQAMAALESLGFKSAEAQRMVKSTDGSSVEEIVRNALKGVSVKK
ncbi:MAG: Holliday junction branch migration protein RuvA [Pseudomonadota bacterium]